MSNTNHETLTSLIAGIEIEVVITPTQTQNEARQQPGFFISAGAGA